MHIHAVVCGVLVHVLVKRQPFVPTVDHHSNNSYYLQPKDKHFNFIEQFVVVYCSTTSCSPGSGTL